MAHVSVKLCLQPRHIKLSGGDSGGEAGLPWGDVRPQQSAGEGESQSVQRTVPERHRERSRSMGTRYSFHKCVGSFLRTVLARI